MWPRIKTKLRRAGRCFMMATVFVFAVLALIVVGPFDALMGLLGVRRRRNRD